MSLFVVLSCVTLLAKWPSGGFGADGRWFESHSSRHVWTLGKSFTHGCLFDVMWCPAWLPCG